MEDNGMERRFFTEKRITQLEGNVNLMNMRIENLAEDVKESKTYMSEIAQSMNKLTDEVISAKAAFFSGWNTLKVVVTVITFIVIGFYTIGYIQMPKAEYSIQK